MDLKTKFLVCLKVACLVLLDCLAVVVVLEQVMDCRTSGSCLCENICRNITIVR